MEWKRLFQVQGQSRKSNLAVRYGMVSCVIFYLTFSYMYYLLYFLYQSFELCREGIAYCLNLQRECAAQLFGRVPVSNILHCLPRLTHICERIPAFL